MNILSVFLVLVLVVLLYCLRKKVVEDERTKLENEVLQKQKESLERECEKLTKQTSSLIEKKDRLFADYENFVSSRQARMEQTHDHLEQGLANYVDLLNKKYLEHEKDFDLKKQQLEQELESFVGAKEAERDAIVSKIDALSKIQEALHQEKLRQEEMESKEGFYKISLGQNEVNDIQLLESIRPKLNQGRVLSMLIWTNFIKKKVDDLFARVYGNANVGIYKITNVKNGKVYIGQSVDLRKRIATHFKCGLGIDTPVTNLLYQDMIKEGVWNFSFELLEQCQQSELNTRERFYINFFKSYEYGYNATKGNN